MMTGKVDLSAFENPPSLLLETSLIFVHCSRFDLLMDLEAYAKFVGSVGK